MTIYSLGVLLSWFGTGPITAWQIKWKIGGNSDRIPLLGIQNQCGLWLKQWNQKRFASWQESDDKLGRCVEKQGSSADKGPYSQGYGLASSHVQLWELDSKEGRMPKNWSFWTGVLEKTPESPLDCKEIKLVNLKGRSILNIYWKDCCWSWRPSILVILCEQMMLWKSPRCWARWRSEREEGIRGWYSWLASLMQWTWIWPNSGRWWGTGGLVCHSL